MTALHLRPLRTSDEAAVRDAQRAMVPDDFEFAFDLGTSSDWSGYVERYARLARGLDVPSDRVPATFLVAVVDGVIVGRSSIRHSLTDWLLAEGGHIGYCVLPLYRRRGFATEILRQSLVVIRSLGVERVLVTCDDDNLGSSSVIEGCGGVLDPDRPYVGESPRKRRYWID